MWEDALHIPEDVREDFAEKLADSLHDAGIGDTGGGDAGGGQADAGESPAQDAEGQKPREDS